jgi:L-serine dehydratase
MIIKTMEKSICRGFQAKGALPGPFKIPRRAPALYKKLQVCDLVDPGYQYTMNWLNAYAIAVGEENAAGGRVVTAPTNGAAGILPAVLSYYKYFTKNANEEGVFKFLLTAGAIGILYKQNASISGAELGCQAEIGVACSMAAGGLVSALGGTRRQIEHAAEIAMEHNLGLTCDPVGGLVQIPCIERNAMGSCQAVSAANLALIEGGTHKVSLDVVMKTMVEVGRNMNPAYKETAKGGLATAIKI